MKYSLRAQFDITDRVALITGAANILGPEFASALAEYGANVVLADINTDACERVAREVSQAYGRQVTAIETDVSQEPAVARLIREVLDTFGRIDILINAAATKTPDYFKPLVDYDIEVWNRVLSVNLSGMFLCTKHVVPHFVDQKKGNIINIASIYGVVGPDPRIYEGSWYLDQQINTPPVYSASKGGVVSFTRYLATTLAQHGIRANCITPGGVFSGQNDAFVQSYGTRVPMGRMAQRNELKGAALFLASDASSYVNGHNLVVDGGFTAW